MVLKRYNINNNNTGNINNIDCGAKLYSLNRGWKTLWSGPAKKKQLSLLSFSYKVVILTKTFFDFTITEVPTTNTDVLRTLHSIDEN